MDIYAKAFEFAKKHMEENSRVNRYHFRDRLSHVKRVLNWARRLHLFEGGDLEVIELAVILHDIGWDEDINHAIVSRQISEEFLRRHNIDETKREKMLEAIEHHNDRKHQGQLNKESYIVMDADILDEVGALSIMWDCMATAMKEDASYYEAYNRMKIFSQQIKDRARLLRTETGKRFYLDRINVIDNYIKDLEYELGVEK